MVKTTNQRPSQLLPTPNPWVDHQFDRAVILFGLTVEGKLYERTSKGRPKYRLEDLLAMPNENLIERLSKLPGTIFVQNKKE